MGNISSDKDGNVTITFSLEEIIGEKVYVDLPPSQPPSGKVWVNHMAQLIIRIAYLKLIKKAPHLIKTFDVNKVSGHGEITVTLKVKNEYTPDGR